MEFPHTQKPSIVVAVTARTKLTGLAPLPLGRQPPQVCPVDDRGGIADPSGHQTTPSTQQSFCRKECHLCVVGNRPFAAVGRGIRRDPLSPKFAAYFGKREEFYRGTEGITGCPTEKTTPEVFQTFAHGRPGSFHLVLDHSDRVVRVPRSDPLSNIQIEPDYGERSVSFREKV